MRTRFYNMRKMVLRAAKTTPSTDLHFFTKAILAFSDKFGNFPFIFKTFLSLAIETIKNEFFMKLFACLKKSRWPCASHQRFRKPLLLFYPHFSLT